MKRPAKMRPLAQRSAADVAITAFAFLILLPIRAISALFNLITRGSFVDGVIVGSVIEHVD